MALTITGEHIQAMRAVPNGPHRLDGVAQPHVPDRRANARHTTEETTMTRQLNVLPFTTATETAVLAPRQLTDYLDDLDDATLEAVRAVGVYLARKATAVQGVRASARLWHEFAAPALPGDGDASHLAALLAELVPTTAPADVPRRTAVCPDVPAPAVPLNTTVALDTYLATVAALEDAPHGEPPPAAPAGQEPGDPPALVPAVTNHGPWPDSQESESA